MATLSLLHCAEWRSSGCKSGEERKKKRGQPTFLAVSVDDHFSAGWIRAAKWWPSSFGSKENAGLLSIPAGPESTEINIKEWLIDPGSLLREKREGRGVAYIRESQV